MQQIQDNVSYETFLHQKFYKRRLLESSKMDEWDYKILEVLSENGRATTREISEATGIQQMSVLRRMKKLEENKVIKNYSIRIDHSKLGFNVVAYVLINTDYGRSERPANMQESVMKQLSRYPFVSCVGLIAGQKDILLRMRARSIAELERFISAINVINEISNTETLVVMKDSKRTPDMQKKFIKFLRDPEFAESFFVDEEGNPLRRGSMVV